MGDPVLEEKTFTLVTVVEAYAGTIDVVYLWDDVKADWVAIWTRTAGQVATASAKRGDVLKPMVEVTNRSTKAIAALFDFIVTKPSGVQVGLGLKTTDIGVGVNETKRFLFTDLTLDEVGTYSGLVRFGYSA
jgi:hypothetical protein